MNQIHPFLTSAVQAVGTYLICNPNSLLQVFPKFAEKTEQWNTGVVSFYSSKKDDPDRRCPHRLVVHTDLLLKYTEGDLHRTRIQNAEVVLHVKMNARDGYDLTILPKKGGEYSIPLRKVRVVRLKYEVGYTIVGYTDYGNDVIRIAQLSFLNRSVGYCKY